MSASVAQQPAHEWQQAKLPREVAEACEPGTRLYFSTTSKCKVLISRTKLLGWHLSISHPWRNPSWEEIKAARHALIPDGARMTMDLPPSDEFVNVHEHCFHLYECACGTQRATP